MGIRFAPSPTGRFHVGNLRTAWISHHWARSLRLRWIVRFEDIDGPRVVPGAMERQLEEMGSLGLEPDQVLVQSAFHERHAALFRAAVSGGAVYPCFCSRKEVQEALGGAASAPHAVAPVYNGRCRAGRDKPPEAEPSTHASIAWRFRAPDESGRGDFIVARSARKLGPSGLPDAASFVPAYNWACAIDDYDGAYDVLVRAWDLEHVIPQQRAIHSLLSRLEGERPVPAVFHCALITDGSGRRLEKRTPGVTLEELAARGLVPLELVERFRASFRTVPRPLLGGEIAGEPRRKLRIGELE